METVNEMGSCLDEFSEKILRELDGVKTKVSLKDSR